MQAQLRLREDADHQMAPEPYIVPQTLPEPRPQAVSSYSYGGPSCAAAGAAGDPPRRTPSLLQAAVEHIKFEVLMAVTTADAIISTAGGVIRDIKRKR